MEERFFIGAATAAHQVEGNNVHLVIATVAILVVTAIVSSLFTRLIRHLMCNDRIDMPQSSILVNVERIIVWGIGISLVMSACFGLDVTALVAALGIGGIAISLGLQDTMKNFLGGMQVTALRVGNYSDVYIAPDRSLGLDMTEWTVTGTLNGAEVFHDYGHNPPEMKNAVSIARKRCRKGRLWAVMQPNNFVRVKELFQDYLTCTKEADITLVTDIYGDRTKDTGGISSEMLVEGMREHGVCAALTPALSDAAAVLRESVQPDDLVITMGGGDIYLLNELLKEPEERLAHESC